MRMENNKKKERCTSNNKYVQIIKQIKKVQVMK